MQDSIEWISLRGKEIAEKIERSFSKVKSKPKYRSDRENHHLVAKKAHNAKYDADILNEVFSLGVEDPRNIVSIKTGLHRRIHTDIYYGWANSVIFSAYETANGDKEKQVSNVSNALASVRTYVLLLDRGAPF